MRRGRSAKGLLRRSRSHRVVVGMADTGFDSAGDDFAVAIAAAVGNCRRPHYRGGEREVLHRRSWQ